MLIEIMIFSVRGKILKKRIWKNFIMFKFGFEILVRIYNLKCIVFNCV